MNTKVSNGDGKERHEGERLTRRAALKRIGITTGMAAFSLLSIDDMARLASKRLSERQLCEGLANELNGAGVAVAQVTTCENHCEQVFIACKDNCTCPPLCNCNGGSPSPHCIFLNLCITACGAARTNCYSDCAQEQ